MSTMEPISHDRLAVPAWERFQGESDPAWQAFVLYRDMGADRSLAKVAQQLGKSKQLMDRWSRKHWWRYRVEEWERHQEQQRQLANNAAIEQMAQRHASQAALALNALTIPQRALLERLKSDPNLIETMSHAKLDELLNLAVRTSSALPALMNAERLARGEPTTIERRESVGLEIQAGIDPRSQSADLRGVLRVLRESGVLSDILSDIDDEGDEAVAALEQVHSDNADD